MNHLYLDFLSLQFISTQIKTFTLNEACIFSDVHGNITDSFYPVTSLCLNGSHDVMKDTRKLQKTFNDQILTRYKNVTNRGCQYLCSTLHDDTCKTVLYSTKEKLCMLTHVLWVDVVTEEDEQAHECYSKVPDIEVYNRDRNLPGNYLNLWKSSLFLIHEEHS